MKKKHGYKVVIVMLDGICDIFFKVGRESYDEDIILQCDKICTSINRLKGIIKRKARIKED